MSDANLGDGAIGRLSEEERDLLCDWWDEENTVGVESAFPIISRIVREHTERAWDEGARRCDQAWREGDAISVFDRNPYRAARQEQS